jgi:hypothetical protein
VFQRAISHQLAPALLAKATANTAWATNNLENSQSVKVIIFVLHKLKE